MPDDLAERSSSCSSGGLPTRWQLANKAGLVVTGFDKVDALIGRGEAAALVCAHDAALGGRERLQRKFKALVQAARDLPARVIDALTVEQMSLAMGRPKCGTCCPHTGRPRSTVLSEAERLARYRSGLGASGPAQVPSQS